VNELGARRVLFGSGYPRSLPGWEREKIKNVGLNDMDYQKIMNENAQQLWGITL
jgi:predicted TIM-barrel fold metal-dependent hydrolase